MWTSSSTKKQIKIESAATPYILKNNKDTQYATIAKIKVGPIGE